MTRILADVHGFVLQRITVRSQRKGWPSCSALGDPQPESRLMFLPERLGPLVVLHELVHTVELNHSSRFLAALAAVAPDYRERDAEFGNAWRLIPDSARFEGA